MAPTDALRQAMEDALAANPDDLATVMAYADHLTEQGDPRGEFVQVQLRMEDPACQGEERRRLKYRETMLLAHEREWLGELASHLIDVSHGPFPYPRPQNYWNWSRGWLDEVSLWLASLEAIRALVRTPAARFLRRLSLGDAYHDTDTARETDDGVPVRSEYPTLYPLSKAPFLEHLRFFRIGEEVDFEENRYNCRTVAEGLVGLVARMPRLEELQVLAVLDDAADLFALPNLTRLKTLVVYHQRDVYPLDVLAANPALRALETLRMHPAHADDDVGYLPFEAVRPLFHSPELRSLKHLHLHASSMGDRGIAELVRSGMLARLETLDLRLGRVTDAGARHLANSPDVHHLKHLSLEYNQLSESACTLLSRLRLPTLWCGNQAALGDDDYLMTGDME